MLWPAEISKKHKDIYTNPFKKSKYIGNPDPKKEKSWGLQFKGNFCPFTLLLQQ